MTRAGLPVAGFLSPALEEPLEPTPPHELRGAERFIRRHAKDAADAAFLLAMCGIPNEGGAR